MKRNFARHGVPDECISDNGPQFDSYEYSRFAKEYGFTLIKSSPYHSQGNGKAESAVKVAKNILKKSRHEDPYLALLAYRNTPTGIHLLYSTKINVTKTAGHHSHGSKSTSTATTSFHFGSAGYWQQKKKIQNVLRQTGVNTAKRILERRQGVCEVQPPKQTQTTGLWWGHRQLSSTKGMPSEYPIGSNSSQPQISQKCPDDTIRQLCRKIGRFWHRFLPETDSITAKQTEQLHPRSPH